MNKPNIDLAPDTRLAGQIVLESPFKTHSGVTLNHFSGGAFSYVAPSARLHHVSLGRYCSVGDGVKILSAHPTEGLTTSPFVYQRLFSAPFDAPPALEFKNLKQTTLGHDVWIGSGSSIKSGVTIGNGAIVGASAVVTHDVAPFSIVVGVPAKPIRMRFSDEIVARLTKLAWWQYKLMGLNLPWEHPLNVLDCLETLVSDGQLQPYCPMSYLVWREGNVFKGKPFISGVYRNTLETGKA
jgi:acetyltransferase-like isoleucine patch superfamily enzyme